ncbi:MAG: tRNA threonylcarbamoyladenosine dehydratase [Clostridia bacterium]|nr:tRNA threonylcarbamoyladenosine dehydratase [Clostridia bacterium]
MDEPRTRMLIGDKADRLTDSGVIIFGLGGVGGYVAEFLVRAGIGRIALVDNDEISPSNFNRQILAVDSNVGQSKVEAAKARLLSINGNLKVDTFDIFFTADSKIDLSAYNCCVDCIDTVASKLELVRQCYGVVPLISCMGTGNKLDTSFKAADIFSTSVCPLARVMRRELKRMGIPSLRVVYSEEAPNSEVIESMGRHAPGSISYVPAAAACVIAREVIALLTK